MKKAAARITRRTDAKTVVTKKVAKPKSTEATKPVVTITWYGVKPIVQVSPARSVTVELFDADGVEAQFLKYRDWTVFRCLCSNGKLSHHYFAPEPHVAETDARAIDVRTLPIIPADAVASYVDMFPDSLPKQRLAYMIDVEARSQM